MQNLRELAANAWVNKYFTLELSTVVMNTLKMEEAQRLFLLRKYISQNVPDEILAYIWKAIKFRSEQIEIWNEFSKRYHLNNINPIIYQDQINLQKTVIAHLETLLLQEEQNAFFMYDFFRDSIENNWLEVLKLLENKELIKTGKTVDISECKKLIIKNEVKYLSSIDVATMQWLINIDSNSEKQISSHSNVFFIYGNLNIKKWLWEVAPELREEMMVSAQNSHAVHPGCLKTAKWLLEIAMPEQKPLLMLRLMSRDDYDNDLQTEERFIRQCWLLNPSSIKLYYYFSSLWNKISLDTKLGFIDNYNTDPRLFRKLLYEIQTVIYESLEDKNLRNVLWPIIKNALNLPINNMLPSAVQVTSSANIPFFNIPTSQTNLSTAMPVLNPVNNETIQSSTALLFANNTFNSNSNNDLSASTGIKKEKDEGDHGCFA